MFFVNDMELEFKGGLKAQVFDWNRTQVKNNSKKTKNSALVNLLYKRPYTLTFEDVCTQSNQLVVRW